MPIPRISDSVVRFHRRYAIFSAIVFILFVMAFIALVVNQHRIKSRHEIKLLENERVREAQRLGISAYVRKPYIVSLLARTVREALDGNHSV